MNAITGDYQCNFHSTSRLLDKNGGITDRHVNYF